MRLLLLLSALLAALTGMIAGQPADAYSGGQAAVASVLPGPVEQVRQAGQRPEVPKAFGAPVRHAPSLGFSLPGIIKADERRLE